MVDFLVDAQFMPMPHSKANGHAIILEQRDILGSWSTRYLFVANKTNPEEKEETWCYNSYEYLH